MNVLLAEDNPVNQEIAVGLLEILDCEVTVAENGREAVDAAGRSAFDLVLMDCQMPVMDGLEATRTIRDLPGASEVPIIALTANDVEAARDDCLAAGMNGLLAKPFTLDDLSDLLQRWCTSPKTETSSSVNVAPSTPSPLNAEPIETLKTLDPNGDRHLVQRTIEKFLSYSDELMAQLAKAFDTSDRAEISRIAHSLKSSSANLGAIELSRQCADIEKLTASAEMPLGLDQKLAALRVEHQLAKRALQAIASET